MTSSQRNAIRKVVVDSIHGDIHLTTQEIQVIDTASFQRLRRLKQLAMAQMVYPTATLTRFAHCMGALGTMIRILKVAEESEIKFDKEQEDNLRLAALLHDIGHYPYSHLMEKVDRVELTEDLIDKSINIIDVTKSKYPNHEEVGKLIVTNQPDLIEAIGSRERAQTIADIFTRSGAADPQLSKLIHSSFDIDRWDYLLRDSHATGVPYGKIDINYLLNNLRISQDNVLGFKEKAIPALEHYLLARFFMYRVVYFHKTIFGLEEACCQLLKRLRDKNDHKYGVPLDGEAIKVIVQSQEGLSKFTDSFVDNIVRKAITDDNEIIRTLALSILDRKPPVLIKEVRVCEETESKYHAGKTFMQNCKNKLFGLSEEFSIPLGLFLICEPKINVLKEPRKDRYENIARLSKNEIYEKVSEDEGEDIKIFKDNKNKPISLMDIDYSFIVKYAKYSLQLYRLYVVYEGKDKEEVIKNLREKVKDWDS